MAGQLKLFNSEWAKLTSDVKLLETVSGYKIEWNNRPPFQTEPPRQCFMNKTEEQAIDTEIERLLEKFIIVKSTHEEGEFLSTIFTRPKRSGGHRMILNLSKLNEFVEYHHFKMDTLEVAIKLIEPHCFMASIDLKDAYYSVPIHVDHQKSYYKSSSVCLFVPYLLRGPLTDLRQTWWAYVGGPRNCP